MMGTTGALRPGELQSSCRGQVEMFRCAAQAPPSTNQQTGERTRPIRVQVQGNYDCGQDVTGRDEVCSPHISQLSKFSSKLHSERAHSWGSKFVIRELNIVRWEFYADFKFSTSSWWSSSRLDRNKTKEMILITQNERTTCFLPFLIRRS